jgi:hypothetical protein
MGVARLRIPSLIHLLSVEAAAAAAGGLDKSAAAAAVP